MEKEETRQLTELLTLVRGISVDLEFLRRHRNVLFGTPILEFDEVCTLLHLSARHVQRLRERKELVGFNVGRRRLYFQTEVYAYIARLEKRTTQTLDEPIPEDDHGKFE